MAFHQSGFTILLSYSEYNFCQNETKAKIVHEPKVDIPVSCGIIIHLIGLQRYINDSTICQ